MWVKMFTYKKHVVGSWTNTFVQITGARYCVCYGIVHVKFTPKYTNLAVGKEDPWCGKVFKHLPIRPVAPKIELCPYC